MKEGRNIILKGHIKGILYALAASLACVLVLALLAKLTGMPDGVIKPIVQVIKVLSIFYGVFIALKGIERHGWLHGGLLGLLYTVLAFFIFSIIDGDFGITAGIITDMIFAVVIGVISAMLLRFGRRTA